MSSTINVLPELVMKRIAAGEVIERPASAVKELLENSLDAGGDDIILNVVDGGKALIQVIDNGCGMSEEDALICCHRHSTSKIVTEEDLTQVQTMGFRGEALASISSVARLEIITCRKNDSESTHLFVEEGAISEVEKRAPAGGTTVTVKDIFYNVPARRKFLKTRGTELRHIMTAFRRIAIAHPEISFRLFVDDEKTLDLHQATVEKRIADLISRERAAELIEIKKEIAGVRLRGFVEIGRASCRERVCVGV